MPENFPIRSGVSQGRFSGPVLYTADLPSTRDTITGKFADDTLILATHIDPVSKFGSSLATKTEGRNQRNQIKARKFRTDKRTMPRCYVHLL